MMSLEGQRYAKKVNSEGQGGYMDHIYKITSPKDDYVNPTTDEKNQLAKHYFLHIGFWRSSGKLAEPFP